MRLVEILVIALGLSMDALAVSVASGFALRKIGLPHVLRMAVFFGFFQALMPLVGWLAGLSLRDWMAGWDHWLAFGLLAAIGVKMIYESTRLKEAEEAAVPMSLYLLVMLSIATSIDAMAVGFSLSLLKVNILGPALIIGCVTFALSFAGGLLGTRFGHFFESRMEVVGGVFLIGIGIKILVDHLLSSNQ